MAEIIEPKEFNLSKKFRANYVLTSASPSTTDQYHIDIDDSHQSSTEPCMTLLVNSIIVASVRRYEDESHTFVLRTTNTANDPAVAHLERWGQQRGDMEVNLRDGQIRNLAWKNRGVYGERFELIDTTTNLNTVLAKFEVGGMLSRGGKMKILVDWGADFEKIVVVSLMTLFEKQSFWGKTYDPRGGKTPIPVPRMGGDVNLGVVVLN